MNQGDGTEPRHATCWKVNRHMSEAEKELFDRMLEEKGREELAAVERELAEEVK